MMWHERLVITVFLLLFQHLDLYKTEKNPENILNNSVYVLVSHFSILLKLLLNPCTHQDLQLFKNLWHIYENSRHKNQFRLTTFSVCRYKLRTPCSTNILSHCNRVLSIVNHQLSLCLHYTTYARPGGKFWNLASLKCAFGAFSERINGKMNRNLQWKLHVFSSKLTFVSVQ